MNKPVEYYHFVTVWKIKAPVDKVWEAIYNSEEWPQWWKAVKDVKHISNNDESGLNGINEYYWRTAALYTLKFYSQLSENIPYKRLAGNAWGELEGQGLWTFEQQGDITRVQYNWDVRTNKKWMNAFSWLLKPVFNYNHDLVMKSGAKGLAEKLSAELLEC